MLRVAEAIGNLYSPAPLVSSVAIVVKPGTCRGCESSVTTLFAPSARIPLIVTGEPYGTTSSVVLIVSFGFCAWEIW